MIADDVAEAYNLIKDLEPTTPQEYILKGVVNAALGQEQGSVSTPSQSVTASRQLYHPGCCRVSTCMGFSTLCLLGFVAILL